MDGLLQKSMRRDEILTGYAFKFGGPINENNGLALLVRLSLRCKRDQRKKHCWEVPQSYCRGCHYAYPGALQNQGTESVDW